MTTMTQVYNFNAGPAALPRPVLEEAQRDLLDYAGTGTSIMEMSHRGGAYDAVHSEAMANLRELLAVPDDYAILLLQGGATMQFAMVPMNLLAQDQTADYTVSGAWGKKAYKEALRVGKVNVAADCEKDVPTRVPTQDELKLTPGAAYLHITTNETISGAQWKKLPETDAPIVADMSSDILSKPIEVNRFGLIYAGAQKNLGPSGVTMVVVRKDLAERAPKEMPAILQYRTHIENDSLYNTPPTFAVYLVMLVTRWLKEQGGLAGMEQINERKATAVYGAIDRSDFYRGTALPAFRSTMNVTFRLPNEDLEKQFVKEADAAGLVGLKGHRSVGGIRASIYNAVPVEGVEALVAFMQDFEKKNG